VELNSIFNFENERNKSDFVEFATKRIGWRSVNPSCLFRFPLVSLCALCGEKNKPQRTQRNTEKGNSILLLRGHIDFLHFRIFLFHRELLILATIEVFYNHCIICYQRTFKNLISPEMLFSEMFGFF